MNDRLKRLLRERAGGAVFFSEPLSAHTTYGVGGAAEALACPPDSRSLAAIVSFARAEGIPVTLVGAGSNVIAPDEGVEGLVVATKISSGRPRFLGDGRVKAGAGILLGDFLRAAAARDLGGAEPLACVPGTVGGAVVMNAGTRDVDIGSILESVEVLTPSGRRRTLTAGELSFGYRRSIIAGSDWIVLGATFRLRPVDAASSLGAIEECWRDRERKYPLDLPSAGSVFKRPSGDYAGRLIEAAGCKGMRIGDAAVSERHANFIVNLGAARAAEILALIAAVRKRVFETSGVWLELEQVPLAARPA